MQAVAQGRDESHASLDGEQITLPGAHARNPILVMRIGYFVQALVERCGPTVPGAPVVVGGIDAVSVTGNPATVGGNHIDIVNPLFGFERAVAQHGEGAAAVGAECQYTIVGAHP